MKPKSPEEQKIDEERQFINASANSPALNKKKVKFVSSGDQANTMVESP